ncbi:50S ribosomal protein L9 [Aquimarina sp. 2201CG5-10]|uniref:50S ribosomal protein L9 n=1 Tax=Aquimarina callyspongiae TaxID=3098150 RepID=UPI002AB43CB2|nr:50S ribosomal protein L9 [Aquimarina sp. 2201CG5-10]MDY8136374.1 50S ribosomal protein L9 [Aquimarina sp. 2201CG5-10]
MELILRKDVENLGFENDVVEVKNGYGRNYLIPHGFAVLATPSAKKVLAETLKQRAFKEKKEIEDAEKIAKKILGLEIKIAAKAGAGNKLFGSVSNADVSEALAKEGVELEKKFITVRGGTIKRLGQYEASVRLHRAVITELPFEVIAQAK